MKIYGPKVRDHERKISRIFIEVYILNLTHIFPKISENKTGEEITESFLVTEFIVVQKRPLTVALIVHSTRKINRNSTSKRNSIKTVQSNMKAHGNI